jgi:hypothetical protein
MVLDREERPRGGGEGWLTSTLLAPRSWAGQPVERAGRHQGPAGGAAKGGGWRCPGPVGRGPGEAEPVRVAVDSIGGRPGVGRGRPSWARPGQTVSVVESLGLEAGRGVGLTEAV